MNTLAEALLVKHPIWLTLYVACLVSTFPLILTYTNHCTNYLWLLWVVSVIAGFIALTQP